MERNTENEVRSEKREKAKKNIKNNNRNTEKEIKIMYANCRGIREKTESLQEIMSEVDPDIVVLNETFYRKNEETKVRGYKSYTCSREDKLGGGTEMLIRKEMELNTIKVSEGVEGVEEMTIRVETNKRVLNIMSMYGKIQGRTPNEKIRDQFIYLQEIIKNIEALEEDYILVGDLNAKIGNGKGGIPGNKQETNEAGKFY